METYRDIEILIDCTRTNQSSVSVCSLTSENNFNIKLVTSVGLGLWVIALLCTKGWPLAPIHHHDQMIYVL